MTCPSGQQTLNQAQLDIEYVTVALGTALNTVNRDVLVKFNRPHKRFYIVSITSTYQASGIFMHFVPLNLPAPQVGNAITIVGTEQWIPLGGGNANHPTGHYVEFEQAINQFYIDAGHDVGSGGAYNITFAGTDDIEELNNVPNIF